ncbi:hypothetical protein PORCAN_2085 [Porphyromonas crevioricanis JCM 13913]|nr:hypothetical protein PORCAN_2085 [Porphyromonas crevioricanis JCM 13913]
MKMCYDAQIVEMLATIDFGTTLRYTSFYPSLIVLYFEHSETLKWGCVES